MRTTFPLLLPLLVGLLLADDALAARAVFAIVVGVNRSADAHQVELHYADDDAARSFELMSSLGARTQLLTRLDENSARLHPQALAEARVPTLARLEDAVKTLAADVARARARGLETDVFFLYAGHGDVKNQRGSISLEDAHVDGKLLRQMFLERVAPDRLHLLIDACASFFLAFGRGPGGERRSLAQFVDVETLAGDDRVGLFLSTSSAAESHEWEAYQSGVFSHEVRSGLLGPADIDLDRKITYRELYAFISSANAAIPNARYRPEVFARPPASSDVIIDLSTATLPVLDVPNALAGRYLLETSAGVRLADFHSGEGMAVRLLRPRGALFLRRVDSGDEWRLPSSTGTVSLASLPKATSETRARGALHESFQMLFAEPVTKKSLLSVRFPEVPVLPSPASLLTPRERDAPRRVAVLDLKPVVDGDAGLAALATAALVDDLRKNKDRVIIAKSDIEDALDLAATRQLMGCADEACSLDLSRVLDVDEVVSGRIGTRSGNVLIFLSRLDPRGETVVGRTSHAFADKGDLRAEIARAERTLFDPSRALAGDARMNDMRTAVLVDETAPDALPAMALASCIESALVEQGVPIVDAAQVARIRSRLEPGRDLPSDLAGVVDEGTVDVIMHARAAYTPFDASMGAVSMVGTGNVRVVQVDTAQVVLSSPMRAIGNGFTAALAVDDTGRRLCAGVRPALERALEERRARGVRVVVEGQGITDMSRAQELARTVAEIDGVEGVRVRRVEDGKAVIDARVIGGDGIALALAAPMGLDIAEASAGRVVIRVR
jgi:hypothetical protein